MFHADMYMAKHFDTNIIKHLVSKTVVSGTRIEPPLHPEGKEKIVKDFGMYPEDFQELEFNSFVDQQISINKDLTTGGIFAPWACYKSELLEIGMHDENFHSYHEDSDIFNRMLLNGMKCIQSRDAFVYHLTCRGGQFQDGIESITQDQEFHKMKNKSMKEYLRKWGSWIKNNEYQHPILFPKYNIAFVVKHCNFNALEALEPWCDRIYIEDEMQVLTDSYIQKEQCNTSYDLKNRVLNLNHNYPVGENDIVVEFDCTKLDNDNFQVIQQLPQIISESGEVGQFELGIFKITIGNLQTYEDKLITNDNLIFI
jgi:hypothetical protein